MAWREHDARVFERQGAIVKLVCVPTELSSILAWAGRP